MLTEGEAEVSNLIPWEWNRDYIIIQHLISIRAFSALLTRTTNLKAHKFTKEDKNPEWHMYRHELFGVCDFSRIYYILCTYKKCQMHVFFVSHAQ